MTKKVVGSMSEWSGVLRDLFRQINDGSITVEQVKALVGHKKSPEECVDILADWQNFYKEIGYSCGDLSGVRIPDDPGGFGRVIIMAKGIIPQIACDICTEYFPCWKYTDKNLDELVTSDRDARQGAYAIRIRDRVEADKELKNLSYNDLKARNIIGITLEEHLINHLKYFKETGKHLDISNITLCSGSLYRDGSVPYVDWYGDCGKLYVYWYSPDYAYDDLRSRRAVI